MAKAFSRLGIKKPAKLKSVAILAMGSSASWYFQDWESKGGKFTDEVWAINAAGVWWRGHTDLLIHMDDLKRDEKRDKKYVERITGTGLPILTCTKHDYSKAIDFPNGQVAKGLLPDDWHFDNSVNYAIGYALWHGVTDLYLYGCEFSPGKSWFDYNESMKSVKDYEPWWCVYYRKPMFREAGEPGAEQCHFLLGVAQERGVKIHLPPGSTLMDRDRLAFWYGPDKQPRNWIPVDPKES